VTKKFEKIGNHNFSTKQQYNPIHTTMNKKRIQIIMKKKLNSEKRTLTKKLVVVLLPKTTNI